MKHLLTRSFFSYCISPNRNYYNPKPMIYLPNKSLWLLLLCLFIFPSISPAWTHSIIDETTFFWQEKGSHCSIAIDSEGFSHISYIFGTYDELYYATNERGFWEIAAVDTTIDKPYGFTSIAIDSDDNIHISYTTRNAGLKYAHKNPTGWSRYAVDSVHTSWTSIAVDAANNVHISYCHDPIGVDGPDSHLKYAERNNHTGEWTIQTIDSTGDVGYYNDIAVDSDNNIHVCYYDKSNTALKYAYKSVDDPEKGVRIGVVETPAASIFKEPMTHVGFFDLLNRRWKKSTIDKSGDVGRGCSLAIDRHDDVHISYYEKFADSESLKYITNKSGDWESEYLDVMDTGATTSIAVDSWSNVHISYWSKSLDEDGFTQEEVKYIKNECGNWEDPERVSAGNYKHESDVGTFYWPLFHSLAVDNSCQVHISLGTGLHLGYAFKEGICSICQLSTFGMHLD